jgi:predicted small metal-binding protein
MKGGDFMKVQDLHPEQKEWIAENCGKFSSEMNCKVVLMAPADQKEDLIEAAVNHAVVTHNEEDTPELREKLKQNLEPVEA